MELENWLTGSKGDDEMKGRDRDIVEGLNAVFTDEKVGAFMSSNNVE